MSRDIVIIILIVYVSADEVALCIEQQIILLVVVHDFRLVCAVGLSFDVLDKGTGVVPVDVIDDLSLDVSWDIVVIILIVYISADEVALCIEQQIILPIVVVNFYVISTIGVTLDTVNDSSRVILIDIADDQSLDVGRNVVFVCIIIVVIIVISIIHMTIYPLALECENKNSMYRTIQNVHLYVAIFDLVLQNSCIRIVGSDVSLDGIHYSCRNHRIGILTC